MRRMVVGVLRGTVFGLCLLLCARVHADIAADHAHTSGPALGVGAGSDNPWLGGHALYYFQLAPPKLRVAVRVGAGLMFDLLDEEQRSWGTSLGALLVYGRRHRLVVGLSTGVRDREGFRLYGAAMGSRAAPSVWLDLGWECMSYRGFYIRSTLGPALVTRLAAPLYERETRVGLAINVVSMGYKPW